MTGTPEDYRGQAERLADGARRRLGAPDEQSAITRTAAAAAAPLPVEPDRKSASDAVTRRRSSHRPETLGSGARPARDGIGDAWTRPSTGRSVVATVDEPAVRIFRWLAVTFDPLPPRAR